MGIRACLSVLLTAGALLVPLFSTSAQQATSTPPDTLTTETATSTESASAEDPNPQPTLEVGSSTASSTAETTSTQLSLIGPGSESVSPFDRGFGAQTETLPTVYENLPGYGAFVIQATIDGHTVSDGDILDIAPRNNIHIIASTTITGTGVISAQETRELAEAVHTTFAIYRGVPGNAEMIAGTYSISDAGILSDIGGEPLESLDVGSALSEPGEYFIAVHPEFGANEYPDGWGPQEFGGPRVELVPKWDFWANHDFYTKQTLYQGSQVFGILRFTIGAPTPEHQMSNVLFLPGIKGSRLYGQSLLCTNQNCEERLWEPGFGEEIPRLYLEKDGLSRENIYIRDEDILTKIDITNDNIYVSLISELSSLKQSGAIERWKIAAYDWRLSLQQIINSGHVEEDRIYYDQAVDSPYIETVLRELASTSKSGKVTIVAHSNGGLVAKALMQKLGGSDTASLIDNVVLLGVPQAGAPQAIGALLFGHKEALPFDWLPVAVNMPQAREFALNSPMSYHLLPTEQYFNSLTGVEHPVVRFYAGTHHVPESVAYDEVIDSVNELYAYLKADEGGRAMPKRADLESANVLNPHLLSYAEDIHAQLDEWTPPEGVTVYQVAGWGADTIAGYEFYEEPVRLPYLTGSKPAFRPIFVEDGDGIVPVPSALLMPQSDRVKNYWINLRKEREGHMTLLEGERVRGLIQEVLLGQEPSEVLNYVSRSGHSPWIQRPEKQLRFALHSPLTLTVTDENGNMTGVSQGGDMLNEIEGGRFGQVGDMKFVSVPFGPIYTINMTGLGEGSFSLDIEEVEGSIVTARKTFAGLPSSATTVATLEASSVVALSNLFVDTNSDGSNDIELPPSESTVAVYEPLEITTPEQEPESAQESGGRSSSSSSGAEGSQSIESQITPITTEAGTAVAYSETENVPTMILEEAATFGIEKNRSATEVGSAEILATTSDAEQKTKPELAASAYMGLQYFWEEFIIPVLYTIKNSLLQLISLIV